jgi:RHS repeat-associated protein
VSEQEDYNDPSGTPTLVASSEYGYNAEGSVTSLDESTTASMVADYALGYDAAQELTQSIDHSTTTNFAYDVLGELSTYGTTTQSYSNEGNRNGAGVTAGNEVTTYGSYTYAYDDVGNETEMYDTAASTTWAYTYDDDNHMNSATETVSGIVSMVVDYKYDAFGNLVEEDISTGSGLTTVTGTKYVIDSWNPAKDGAIGLSGSDVIADLRASDGSLETRYVWGDGVGQLFGRYDAGPMLTTDPAGTYFTMTHQNGSVRDIVDSAGSDVDTITYDAFGKALTGIGSYSGHYTFDGYDYDAAATKFYLNNARVYDPESGRWLSQDPMGFAAGDSNLYRYVNNAPTNGTDPSGMQSLPEIGINGITYATFIGTPIDAQTMNGLFEYYFHFTAEMRDNGLSKIKVRELIIPNINNIGERDQAIKNMAAYLQWLNDQPWKQPIKVALPIMNQMAQKTALAPLLKGLEDDSYQTRIQSTKDLMTFVAGLEMGRRNVVVANLVKAARDEIINLPPESRLTIEGATRLEKILSNFPLSASPRKGPITENVDAVGLMGETVSDVDVQAAAVLFMGRYFDKESGLKVISMLRISPNSPIKGRIEQVKLNLEQMK